MNPGGITKTRTSIVYDACFVLFPAGNVSLLTIHAGNKTKKAAPRPFLVFVAISSQRGRDAPANSGRIPAERMNAPANSGRIPAKTKQTKEDLSYYPIFEPAVCITVKHQMNLQVFIIQRYLDLGLGAGDISLRNHLTVRCGDNQFLTVAVAEYCKG